MRADLKNGNNTAGKPEPQLETTQGQSICLIAQYPTHKHSWKQTMGDGCVGVYIFIKLVYTWICL
jgi:hypothetical protein